MQRYKTTPWGEPDELACRSSREVIEDHIRLQISGRIEEDLQRNYAQDVVLLTAGGRPLRGHEAVRDAAAPLYRHRPGSCYEMVALQVNGDYGLLVWKAEGRDYAVDCAADSFVVSGGKIRMQTTHYKLLEPVARDASVG